MVIFIKFACVAFLFVKVLEARQVPNAAFVGPWGAWSKANSKSSSKSASSTSSSTQSKDLKGSGGASVDNRGRKLLKGGLPPTLLILFGSAEAVQASPLNRQAIMLKSPFFQGWLVRVTDHENSGSFVLIVGSFSMAESDKYDEHYIFCGIEAKKLSNDGFYVSECAFHSELFPSTDTVTISGGKATTPLTSRLPFHGSPTVNISWAAENVGHFKFQDETCEADLNFDDFRLRFNATSRLPWSNDLHANSAGPEGWLGYTSLLPCHYFVHSVGSLCDYSIELPVRDSAEDFLPAPPPPPHLPGLREPSLPGISDRISSIFLARDHETSMRQQALYRSIGGVAFTSNDWSVLAAPGTSLNGGASPRPLEEGENRNYKPERICGRGWAHIEGNHGTFFPEGWVWAQAVNEDNSASMSLVMGKFKIGVVAPLSTVLYVRSAKHTRIFRSTDLDKIKVERIDHSCGEVALTAVSPRDGSKVEVIIKGSSSWWVSDALPIHIPTATGFSRDPGCKETYSATAKIRCYRQVNARRDVVSILRPEYELEEELEFPMTALEFGAGFLESRVGKRDIGKQ